MANQSHGDNPSGKNSLWHVLADCMDQIPAAQDRFCVCNDAQFHRSALLSAIEFIGLAIESSTTIRQHPRQYTPDEISKLGEFLMSAPELIRGMDAVTEGHAKIDGGEHDR